MLLLIPVIYAYRQFAQEARWSRNRWSAAGAPRGPRGWSRARPNLFATWSDLLQRQDPLLFLVPALFTLACSLLLVRIFPLLMRIGDWLGGVGRDATLYLAFRQLARQSSQYTSALLLVITSLSLGAFMASMAASLDQWLIDQVHYAVGSDVFIKQIPIPASRNGGLSPTEGRVGPADHRLLEVPGVTHAARVGMYPATDLPGRAPLAARHVYRHRPPRPARGALFPVRLWHRIPG